VHDGLAAYAPPKMRLQPVLAGDLLIINDAYNASPASMDAAFEVLQEAGRGRRLVAVLGEMKELGEASARMHRQVGASIARRPVALLITVERGGDQIADGAEQAGLDRSAIIRTASVEEASGRLRDLVRPNDVVLVKGSRALEMERIVDRLVEAARA
jgi:UDP-N-acetylmuramoyl-tripeptide--D-alanyl-D-alanine ligase